MYLFPYFSKLKHGPHLFCFPEYYTANLYKSPASSSPPQPPSLSTNSSTSISPSTTPLSPSPCGGINTLPNTCTTPSLATPSLTTTRCRPFTVIPTNPFHLLTSTANGFSSKSDGTSTCQ